MKFITKLIFLLILSINLLFSVNSIESIEKSQVTQVNHTNGNDWGNGSVFYLDRHSVDCGAGKILQGFHLHRPRSDQIAYEFRCLGSPAIQGNSYNTQTPWNDTGNNERHSTNYLDRHDVRCKPGYGLQQFKMIRNGNRIAYAFRCVAVAAQNCQSRTTSESFGNRLFQNIYLDRQNVFAGDNRLITQFKLNTRYSRGAVYYTYGFTSCEFKINRNRNIIQGRPYIRPRITPRIIRPRFTPSVRKPNPVIRINTLRKQNQLKDLTRLPFFNKRTSSNDWGNGSVFYLDRHDVDCKNGLLLQGFHLTRPTSNTISYEYVCLKNPSQSHNSYSKQTPFNDTSNNERSSTNYLDRHLVVCKKGFALQRFKLIRRGNKIAYDYTCSQTNLSQCVSKTTSETFGNRNFENIYLDRQRVLVGTGQVLTSFKLNSRYSGGAVNYTYSYTACTVSPDPSNLPTTFHKSTKPNQNSGRIIHNNRNIKITRKNYFGYRPHHPAILIKENQIFDRTKFQLIKVKNGGKTYRFNKKKGNKFCREHCVSNLESRKKFCFDKGVKSCNRCQYKNHDEIDRNKETDQICRKACNAVKGNDTCKFYPYINDRKKIINKNLLSKFGLKIFKRFLYKLK